jgi:hypothetical protein
MGMCCSGDIFQAKIDEILGNIEGVKTYIYGICLVINKGSSDDHCLEQFLNICLSSHI